MSKVKFIQLGNEANPISNADYTATDGRSNSIAQTIKDYPGAIIFATFKNEADETQQEIYANGTKYSVGGGGANCKFYYGSKDINESGQIPADATVYGADGAVYTGSYSHGDYYVKREDVYKYTDNNGTWTKTETVNAVTATAYVRVGKGDTAKWEALSGNVLASNVWFPGGIRRNQPWGKKTDKPAKSVKECVGYNLDQVMQYYLLEVAAPPEPTIADNLAADPTIAVTCDNTITFNVRTTDSTTGQTVSGSIWAPVGTTYYIPANDKLEYTKYNLTRIQSSEKANPTSLTEGGATISGMTSGYWDTQADADKMDPETLVKVGSVLQTSKTGSSTTAAITYKPEQTDGTCSLTLSSSNFTRDSSTHTDTVETITPSTEATLKLTESTSRTFKVENVYPTVNSITVTGVNGNKWEGERAAFALPAVGPVYISNSENSQYHEYTKPLKNVAKKSLTSSAISDKTITFKVKGYWPIYSNFNSQDQDGRKDVTQINLPSNYDTSTPHIIQSTIKWGADPSTMLHIYYPSSKTLSVLQQNASGDWVAANAVKSGIKDSTYSVNNTSYYKSTYNGFGSGAVFKISIK